MTPRAGQACDDVQWLHDALDWERKHGGRQENAWLRAQNDELQRQLDYVRALVWDDIPPARTLAHLRHTLDRPKLLGRPNGA